jgi:tRNA pseudouridine55 synthase
MASPDRFHGLLVIDKPAGWTSHDVVGRVRRLLGQRSVGHAGTLDPAATGVLPVAVGSALRALEYLADASKSYRAEITFGVSTDTIDVDGRLNRVCEPPQQDRDTIDRLLAGFVGPLQQIPPIYSAIKIDGTPLYERARRGEAIEPPTRSVWIHDLDLIEWNPPVLTVDIDCSKGFYVRSFARDLGERIGSCAYLSNLIRTRVASFTLCDAWTLSDLSAAPLLDEWETIAIAPDAPAQSLPAVVIESQRVQDWSTGKRWIVDASIGDSPVRVYDSAGNWLGIGELVSGADGAVLQPRKVIPVAGSAFEERR